LPLAALGGFGLVTLEVAFDPPQPAEIITAAMAASIHNGTAFMVLGRLTLPSIM
jgi:hypothetical protein